MASRGSSATLYSRISPIQLTDYTPSRVTRPSSNTFLQEHDMLSELYCAALTDRDTERKPRSRSDLCVSYRAADLKGRYVDLKFASSYTASERYPPVLAEEVYAERRAHSQSDPFVRGTADDPLCMRSRVDCKRTAVRRRNQSNLNQDYFDSASERAHKYTMTDTAGFATDQDTERKRCSGDVEGDFLDRLSPKPVPGTPLGVLPTANKLRVKRQRFSPPSTPPPPPPAPYGGSYVARVRLESATARPEVDQPPERNSSDEFSPPPSEVEVGPESIFLSEGSGTGYISLRRQEIEEVDGKGGCFPERTGIFSQLATEGVASAEESTSEEDETVHIMTRLPSPPPGLPRHRYVNIDELSTSTAIARDGVIAPAGPASAPQLSPLLPQDSREEEDICPPPLSPSRLPQTRPVPPPRRMTQQSLRCHSDSRVVRAMKSSPDLHADARRTRSVSFLQCKAGEEHGKFAADYMGSVQTNCYLDAVNQAAKQLVDSKPVEVVTYVTSERVRLAPPNNSALLFKSFAMKDILMVQRCSKNKRIIGIVLWKSCSTVPVCHILRCTDHLIANSLYEAIWLQSQSVDDVALSKWPFPSEVVLKGVAKGAADIEAKVALDEELDSLLKAVTKKSGRLASEEVSRRQLRPPSEISSSDSSTSPSPEMDAPRSSSISTSSVVSPLSATSTSSSVFRDTSVSPLDLLHKLPAMYIGSTMAGKLHTVNEVIQKVLSENRPSQAKEACVWLSLAQIRLVAIMGDQEIVFATHETSRIRAIGVYSLDKRFIGYIIKEEGRPLTGHVLRCNSAGLMVSLVSFLRQSCQITFHQRGGSFYDELSTDDSEEYDSSETLPGRNSPGIIRRLRSLTASSPSPSPKPNPSFVSHTSLLRQSSSDAPPSKRDAVQTTPIISPLDFPEEDYARFSVNYVGSATLMPPMTKQSVIDALEVFTNEGVAKGQAAIPKNIIQMQVSALGINLSDRKHRLFVNRNYPRNQLAGYCLHPHDRKYFAFSSQRPGFPDSIKCHVFKQLQVPTEQIMDAIKFWTEINPITF